MGNRIIDANNGEKKLEGSFGIQTIDSKLGVIANNHIIRSWREAININSKSSQITITNNMISETGDGGIVMGSDYILNDDLNVNYNATNQFVAKFQINEAPSSITISGNVIEFTYDAGISCATQDFTTSIVGNMINNS